MKKYFAAGAIIVLGLAPFVSAFAAEQYGDVGPPGASAGAPQLTTASNIINWLRWLLFIISLIFWVAAIAFVIYAGYLFLFGGTSDDALKRAKAQLKYAVIAIVVALLSTVLPTLIANVLRGR